MAGKFEIYRDKGGSSWPARGTRPSICRARHRIGQAKRADRCPLAAQGERGELLFTLTATNGQVIGTLGFRRALPPIRRRVTNSRGLM